MSEKLEDAPFIVDNSDIAKNTHVATHYGSYFTSTSERGVEVYKKSTEGQPPDEDLQLYRF
jgi:hypothetical protein